MSTRRYRSAGGIVIHDAQVLLLDRPSRNEVRLPKGHIEAGEDAATAAVRETAEESGYDDLVILADLGSKVVEFEYDSDHYVRTEHYFLMTLRSDRQGQRSPKDREQFKVRWTQADAALAELTYPAEQDALRRALQAHQGQVGDR